MSLALNGGASKDIVRWSTHPRPADVFDLYVTPSWEALCQAVSCVHVAVKLGEVVALSGEPAANSNRMASEAAPETLQEESPAAL
jgi:hypothetical protein